VSLWVLAQVLLNLILLAGLGAAWVRLKRPPNEDPRLSKGLQLLQSKIAVLEDLSDRTETQVRQLNALLESKCIEIQNKMIEAEKIIGSIESSRQKSMQVAKIFEDKIPHQEIVERQNTIKYVKAARLAHQGTPTSEILKQVDLSQAEVEFIAKVNREQLMFSEQDLPDWITQEMGTDATKQEAAPVVVTKPEAAAELPTIEAPQDEETLRRLGEEFKRAVQNAERTSSLSLNPQHQFQLTEQSFMEIELEKQPAKQPTFPTTSTGLNAKGQMVEVRPFEFKRISR
jgi:mannose/fructose/N-acetylgalactosamine-specific phosphotransferase system component IIB